MPIRHERIDLRYRLHFHSAFHFGTGLRAGLVHRAIARRRDGLPFVPGSTLKGVLRDHATQIARLFAAPARTPHPIGEDDVREFARAGDIVASIFGSRVQPGGLFFDDAQLCEEDRRLLQTEAGDTPARQALAPTETRTQVSMSRRLGTARRGLLFTSEYGLPDLRFEGRIFGALHSVPLINDSGRSSEASLLMAALYSLDRIGGNTSAGAGQVSCAITALTINDTLISEHDWPKYLSGLEELEIYQLNRDEPA